MADQKKGLSRSLLSVGGLVAILVILVFVNIIFANVNLRWDATNDKLYSLSDGTKKIISDLKEDVVLKVFYTKDVVNTPTHIRTYAKRMIDFLREYEYHSDGKITVEIYNPVIDSEEEEWAVKYGLEPIDLPTGDRIFFGLVATAADQEETISMLDPAREQQLEYDITRLITQVQTPTKPKIGVLSSLPVFGDASQPFMQGQRPQQTPSWLYITELEKTYDVEEIPTDADRIDNDLDLLIIHYPKNISETTMYAIDQYILNGGAAIVYLDPFCISDESPDPSKASNMEQLLAAWGVGMEPGKILTDFDYTTKLRTQNNQVEDNPLWISVPAAGLNSETIITSELEKMLMPLAGAINIKETKDSKLEYEPLATSSVNAALTDAFKIRFGTAQLRRDFTPTRIRYNLAVNIHGTFKSAFPDGKPEAETSPDDDAEAPPANDNADHLTEGKKPTTVIVVADADLLQDAYYVSQQNFLGFMISRMFNDNLNLLLNVAEMLTGNEELINIRSRGTFERPFTRVQELEKKAQAKWMEKEQELVKKLEETNQKLRNFEQQKDESQKFIVSSAQEAEIRKFQEEKLRINKELKDVRRNLRKDIEELGNRIKFINIFLMPILVSLAGLLYGVYLRKKGS